MGHAAHFLRRLDRVSDGQVELALTLYRDDALLREVLRRAVLPDDAERVAISLEDPIEGPFVVVTREGRFVTCLGRGMLVRDLPIVTREKLDVAAARVERMREELDRVRTLRDSGAEGQAALAFRRMQQQGPRFAREDARTLLRVQPLIEAQCLDELRALHLDANAHLRGITRFRFDAPERMPSLEQDYLVAFGDMVWALAHMLVLLDSRSILRDLRRQGEQREHDSLVTVLAHLTFGWGTFTHSMRALWFVARGGKPALAAVKALSHATTIEGAFRELALTAIALGSEKLRAEAMKAQLARTLEEVKAEPDPLRAYSALFAAHGREIIERPQMCEERYLFRSRHYAACARTGKREVSEEEIAAVPDDVARIAYIASQSSIHGRHGLRELLCAADVLPWLVRASAEELFVPREWATHLFYPRGVVDVVHWLRPYLEALGLDRTRTPKRAAAAPGRNDPCPCGSGKKHKRCCGATR